MAEDSVNTAKAGSRSLLPHGSSLQYTKVSIIDRVVIVSVATNTLPTVVSNHTHTCLSARGSREEKTRYGMCGMGVFQATSRMEKEDKWKKVLTLQRKRMAISLITASHLYKVDL